MSIFTCHCLSFITITSLLHLSDQSYHMFLTQHFSLSHYMHKCISLTLLSLLFTAVLLAGTSVIKKSLSATACSFVPAGAAGTAKHISFLLHHSSKKYAGHPVLQFTVHSILFLIISFSSILLAAPLNANHTNVHCWCVPWHDMTWQLSRHRTEDPSSRYVTSHRSHCTLNPQHLHTFINYTVSVFSMGGHVFCFHYWPIHSLHNDLSAHMCCIQCIPDLLDSSPVQFLTWYS